MVRVLQGKDSDKLGDRGKGYPKNKTEALRFLGHWLADIHQPLHISYGDDRGGNDILVEGVKGCSKRDKMDEDGDGDKTDKITPLHTVWDTCVVHDSMEERGLSKATSNRTPYSKALHKEITDSQRSIWTAEMSRKHWAKFVANESYALAQGGLVNYCLMNGGECWYSSTQRKFKESESRRTVVTSEVYADMHRAVVETRIKKAGVRLGLLLNKILGQ